jgi:hypothetical protein
MQEPTATTVKIRQGRGPALRPKLNAADQQSATVDLQPDRWSSHPELLGWGCGLAKEPPRHEISDEVGNGRLRETGVVCQVGSATTGI